MPQSSFQNKLIRRLSEADFATVRPHLERIGLKARDMPVRANRRISHVYFLESGQFSVLAKVSGAEPIEVGMICREGMSDMVPDQRTPFDTIVQVAGDAHRVDAAFLSKTAVNSPTLSDLVMRYHRAKMVQISYTALSHGSSTVPQRLARWLLMMHDRLDGDELPLTHEVLSWMLAVRRAGVTEALGRMAESGAIRASRGKITILRRKLLIELAAGSYGPAEAEYDRLLGRRDVAA